MRKLRFKTLLLGLSFALLTPLSALADVTIDEEHFPDANFRAYLLKQDYGEDGMITDEEIAQITEMNVNFKGINSLEGIQYFTALTELGCSNNQLTALDVSGCTALTGLWCNYNRLTALDVSGCTALTELGCSNNQLTALDVSGCTALTELRCFSNQLTTLDVSKNTALTELWCAYNKLTALDVSGCTALTSLHCNSNQLTELNVSGCTGLTKLQYATDHSSALKVIGGTTLQSLSLGSGQITGLDVSECTALTYLDCSYNQLTSLDVSHNTALTYLECRNNPLTELNVSGCTGLTELEYCTDKSFALKVIGGTTLQSLSVLPWTLFNGQITGLDVSECPALTSLSCQNNRLTALDVSKNTALTYLSCYRNQLTSLNVSNNTALIDLNCVGNQLTILDVSNNTALTSLDCWNNKIYGEEMDKIVESLREYDGTPGVINGSILIININSGTEGNICTWNQADAIMAKGWRIYNEITKYNGLTKWNVEMHEGQGEYWATLYAPFGYTLPEGTEAYVGTLNEDKQTLNMTSIGREVPRGVPVVIKGNSVSVVAEVDDRITAEIGDNDLIGKYEPFDATGTDVYTLGIYEDIVGFYKDKGTTERFKAVLELPEGIAANGYRMVFEDDDITAIEDASVIVDNANAVYYDLQGRRVAEPQKGQLYIVNGKTVLYQP